MLQAFLQRLGRALSWLGNQLLLWSGLCILWAYRRTPKRRRGFWFEMAHDSCKEQLQAHPAYLSAVDDWAKGLAAVLVSQGVMPNDGEGHYTAGCCRVYHPQGLSNGRGWTLARRRNLAPARQAARAHFSSPAMRWLFVHLHHRSPTLPRLSHHEIMTHLPKDSLA